MNIEAIKSFVGILIRHGLTTFGGGLLSAGVITQGDIEIVSGAIAVVVGLVLSQIEKRKKV